MSTSDMANMSRAIRLQIEATSADRTLAGLSDQTLEDYVAIVGAFYIDLKQELERRVT
jgi:hypothetical protein